MAVCISAWAPYPAPTSPTHLILYQTSQIIWLPRWILGKRVCFRPRGWGQEREDSGNQAKIPDSDLSTKPLWA